MHHSNRSGPQFQGLAPALLPSLDHKESVENSNLREINITIRHYLIVHKRIHKEHY